MRGTELNIHRAQTRPRGFPDNSKRSRRRGLKNSPQKGALFFISRVCCFVTQLRGKKKKHDVVFKMQPPRGLRAARNGKQRLRSDATELRGDGGEGRPNSESSPSDRVLSSSSDQPTLHRFVFFFSFNLFFPLFFSSDFYIRPEWLLCNCWRDPLRCAVKGEEGDGSALTWPTPGGPPADVGTWRSPWLPATP